MIIDGRNLPQNSPKQNITLPTLNSSQTRDLIRLLDNKYVPSGSDTPAPANSGSDTPRTDALDLSTTGFYNLKETRLEFACDMEYTKETAVTNAWVNSQNALFKHFGNSGKISDEAVVGMSKEDFAEYMKTHELDREINWSSVNMQVWGSCDYDSFTKFTHHLGALYASLEDRINADFQGEEQAEQLERLNAVYDKAVNEAVENMVSKTERTFGDLGAALPQGKLEKSIRQVIKDKTDAYRSFIAENKDYAKIKNTEDKWLARDIGYMTCALKTACKPETAEAQDGSEELWSENDILVLGVFGSMYSGAASKELANLQVMRANDEESLGLEISRRWLSDRKVLSSFDPDEEVKSLCGKLFESYVDNLIKNADNAVKIIGKTTMEGNPYADETRFLPIDKKSVYAVLEVMKESYKEGEKTALIKTAAFARSEFLKKSENSTLWRYNNEFGTNAKRFWENLYSDSPQNSGKSAMKAMLEKWEAFDGAVSSKDMYGLFKQIGYGVRPD